MDIVERLLDLEANLPTTSDNWIKARELQQEAAAEITRLREIEKDWQAMRDERDAARTGYDCLLGENRELVKLEAENERMREALKQIMQFAGQIDLVRDGNWQTAVEIVRAALSGKAEGDCNRADQA